MLLRLVTGILALAVLASCGPIQTTISISRADEKIRAAKLANAQADAPYELTGAGLFLEEAKQREGRSDFQAAKEYGDEALRLATAAVENAPRNAHRKEIKGKNVVPAGQYLTNPALGPAPATPAAPAPGGKGGTP
jgi:hypothetical protein